jgi:hypothetical protein
MASSRKKFVVRHSKFNFWDCHEITILHKVLYRVPKLWAGTVHDVKFAFTVHFNK